MVFLAGADSSQLGSPNIWISLRSSPALQLIAQGMHWEIAWRLLSPKAAIQVAECRVKRPAAIGQ
jgi:hypothetical protein